ncbi:MAG: crossover junction endodeoxyribonuclease RuvC [Candidatus Adlerbacteria bacterium]
MQPNKNRVLAFDPGFERLGVAVVEKVQGKEQLIHSDCIRTSASLPFAERLLILGRAAEELITQWGPGCAALENVFFEKNAKTAMDVAAVRGLLLYLAAEAGLVVYEYTPLQVKVAITGYGQSDKSAVGMMVPRLVSLPAKKRLDDEIDAIAIGLTCLASVRGPR